MGSGVSESHERRCIKFRLRHSGVSSAVQDCHVTRPQSGSVFVCLCLRHSGVSSAVRELPFRSSPEWVCPRLRLSPSAPVYVFARPRLRLSPFSSVSVVVAGGWSRGRRLSVRCSTSRVLKPPWRARFRCVRYFVLCAVSKKLCCDVFP